MVGLFINTLPLRVRLAPAQAAARCCCGRCRTASRGCWRTSISGLPRSRALAGLGELFDTLVVFENYPVDRDAACGRCRRSAAGRASSGHDATHYPLSLVAAPGEQLRLRLDYRPDLFDRGERRGDWRAGWCGCWRRRLRSRIGRSAGSTFCRRAERAHHPGGLERDRAAAAARHPAAAVRGAGGAHAGGGRGGVRGRSAELRASSMRAPTSWRIICAGSGSGPRWWSGCASSARWRWWSGCSASSRPAAPICRSIPTTRRSGSPSCWRMPAPPVLVTQSALLDRLPAHGAPHACSSMPMRPTHRAAARHARPPSALDPQQHRLRDLHLGLDRNAQRRRWSRMTACPIWPHGCRSITSASTPRARVLQFDVARASMPRSGRCLLAADQRAPRPDQLIGAGTRRWRSAGTSRSAQQGVHACTLLPSMLASLSRMLPLRRRSDLSAARRCSAELLRRRLDAPGRRLINALRPDRRRRSARP